MCHKLIPMAKKQYQLHLKGFVGGYDFDADYVDYILAKNKDAEVNVLIDSFGGQASTALSISSAFKRHGNVHVHFVGMNASAATIASLGARHITMDKSAMYLVHKCSVEFFQWGSMNADDLATLIANVEKQKKDLDKFDANIAEMYAAKCKKSAADLLQLMKQGGWLNSSDALAWGFVDEITDDTDDQPPVMTDDMALAMANAGIPIPEQFQKEQHGILARFLQSLAAFFHAEQRQAPPTPKDKMNKTFKRICAILTCENLQVDDGKVTIEDKQMDTIEAAIDADKASIADLNDKLTKAQAEAATLKAEVDRLKKQPADDTHNVLDSGRQPKDADGINDFVETAVNARALYDILP